MTNPTVYDSVPFHTYPGFVPTHDPSTTLAGPTDGTSRPTAVRFSVLPRPPPFVLVTSLPDTELVFSTPETPTLSSDFTCTEISLSVLAVPTLLSKSEK